MARFVLCLVPGRGELDQWVVVVNWTAELKR